ncbi:hypothetical protein LSH36_105g04043 [Paralvinella palmiformis]|uniref:beta-mannosidase n=1 Tax=Paralvinella palmiformis TaxID=53620 RepID=A0AAD9NB30_9ANNE|nr:hypothetical protein LSH36_105g04043 [Paralvinella palmiformis]
MSKTTWSDVAKKLEACLADISTSMCANMLKLNEEKIELIIFDPKHNVRINEELRLTVALSVKNLGVYFETPLTMERQVNAISKACYYQIRSIGHIRRYISLDACKTLAHALITYQLDYGNAFLYGLPSTPMTQLLPGTAPQYLEELVVPYQPTKSLRSQTGAFLAVPTTRGVTYGNRCFRKAAATLWNNLQRTLRHLVDVIKMAVSKEVIIVVIISLVTATIVSIVTVTLTQNNDVTPLTLTNRDSKNIIMTLNGDNWTLSTNDTVSAELAAKPAILLICDGLDTIATVYLNEAEVGSGVNQFVRYVYNITDVIKTGTNNITVELTSAVTYAKKRFDDHPYRIPPECPPDMYHGECHVNMIRKAACSFSWDWGPAFATQGIWKNIWIEGVSQATIRDVVSHVSRVNGSFDWQLNVTTLLDVATNIKDAFLYINITPSGMSFNASDVTLNTGKDSIVVANLTVPKSAVDTWWPRGYGTQPLYDLVVTLADSTQTVIDQKTVKIGFRTVVVVQDPIPNGLTFYFVINDVPIYMKGSNWIPIDAFQDNITPERISRLLDSAAAVNMNTIRVWGGGIYETDQFYDVADQLGLLIWQDLMFACNMYPVDDQYLDNVREEIRHQVRRLSSHPCLVAWTANNENEGALVDDWYDTSGPLYERYKSDYVKLYIDTIRNIILDDDYTRPFLSSSPSNGKVTEENGWISEDPKPSSPHYGDIHYYNYEDDCLDHNIYQPARYSSEYGYQSWPAHSTLSKVSASGDLVYGSDFINHRQHHFGAGNGTEQVLRRHFTWPNSGDPELDFKNIIYLFQTTQAMCYKTQTEHYRRTRSDPTIYNMGALYWQHSDIWQAPSWATIDYDDNWKMAHYYARHFFADLLVSSITNGSNIDVYTITDSISDVIGVYLVIKLWNWNSPPGECLHEWRIVTDVPASAATLVYRRNLDNLLAEGACTQRVRCVLTLHLQTADNIIISPINPHYLVSWKDISGMIKPVIQVQSVKMIGQRSFQITLSTNQMATFVWLEAYDIKGYFSDNGFLWVEDLTRNVTFSAWQDVTEEDLLSAITVKCLADIY